MDLTKNGMTAFVWITPPKSSEKPSIQAVQRLKARDHGELGSTNTCSKVN